MNNQAMVNPVEKEKFSITKMLGYALYKGSATMNGLLVSYLTYYATDSLFLSAAAIGGVLAFSRIFDGITDIAAGILIDRTNTRIGRARPYIICGILAYIAMAFMFSTPDLPDFGKLVWIFITYNLNSSIFQTLCAIADASLLKRIIVKQDNRVRTLSYTGIFVNVASTVVNVVLPLVVSMAAADSHVWSYLGWGMGAVGSVMLLIAFIFCKEYTVDDLIRFGIVQASEAKETQKMSLKQMALGIIKNKYFLIYLFVFFVNSFYLGISYGVQTYYYASNLGNLQIMSTVSLLLIVTWPLNAVYPIFIRRTGAAKFAKYMLIVGAAGSIARMFVGANVIGLAVTGFLSGWVVAGISLIGSEITIQCMDYSYLKNGLHVESLYNSFLNFSMKVGMGIGAAFLGIMLTQFGYDGSLAVQPDSALSAINFFFNIFPAVCAALMFIGLNLCKVEDANRKLRGEL